MINKPHTNQSDARNAESGNVLWIILIAVALLGALSLVMSDSASNTSQSGDIEQNRILASQLTRYAAGIESGIQNMQLQGIAENDISFATVANAASYTNTNCDDASDRSYPTCLLFDVEGQGIAYQDFSAANDGSDWIFTSANNVGTTADPIGSTAARSGNDIVMLLPNAKTSLCIQINRDLDVGTAGTLPDDDTGVATTPFTGTFTSSGPTILDGDPTPFELDGQSAGCFTDTDAGVTYFYHVLLAR